MNTIVINKVCPICNKSYMLTIRKGGYMLWKAGIVIQEALPELALTERESLISGLCADCQSIYFDDPEDV